MYKNNKIFSAISHVYLLCIVFLFPLFYTNYYYNILDSKYYFYIIITIVFCILSVIIRKMSKKIEKIKINKIDMAVLILWIEIIISTLQSNFLYESFWGNEGRYTGLFLITIYVMEYFFLRKVKINIEMCLDVFLLSGLLVACLGIMDYFGMDLLGFKENMMPSQINMFTSTIGNINSYTAYMGSVVAVSSILFSMNKTKKVYFYYVCMIFSMFATILGRSDNAYLSLGILIVLLPIFLFVNLMGMKRFIIFIVSFCTLLVLTAAIQSFFAAKVIKIDGIFATITQMSCFRCLLPSIGVVAIIFFIMEFKKIIDDSTVLYIRHVWICLLFLFLIIMILLIIYFNVTKPVVTNGIQKLFIFNDDWGTHRGYIWRLSARMFKKFSFRRKLWGYGPETFGILSTLQYKKEMITLYNEIFDNAHNEYLQILITTGILGLSVYIYLIVRIMQYLYKFRKSPYALTIFLVVVCYCTQAFVNLNVPVVTPIIYTLVIIGINFCNNKKFSEH